MDLLNIIKKAAIDAVKQAQPCNVLFGRIESVNPLRVRINQKLILSSEFLVLTRTMWNCQVGENVVVLKAQGGQKYIVLDRL